MGLSWGLGVAETCRGPDEVCVGDGGGQCFSICSASKLRLGVGGVGDSSAICACASLNVNSSATCRWGKNRCLRKTAEALLLGHLGRSSKEK